MRKTRSPSARNHRQSLAIVFPHPLNGSLGSTRRVKEIALSLSRELDVRVNIYTPYERRTITFSDKVAVKPTPSALSALGLTSIGYRLSKKLYYSRLFSKRLLARSLGFFKFVSHTGFRDLLSKDGAAAIQAEQDLTLPLALELGKELHIPVIADLHNISAEELVATRIFKRTDPAYRELQNHTREWLSDADFVCVVSEEMKRYVRAEYEIDEKKTLIVPPGGRRRPPPRKVKTGNKVIFIGTVSNREHVDLYAKSAPIIRERVSNAEFYATQKGEDLGRIKRLCKKLNVQMRWFWFHDEEGLFRLLHECKVGVLPSSNDQARIMGTPIKLLDYMSTGLPVVANNIGGWTRIIEEEEIGILTHDNPKSFADATLRLLGDNALREKMANNALEAVEEKHNWEISVCPLVKIYADQL